MPGEIVHYPSKANPDERFSIEILKMFKEKLNKSHVLVRYHSWACFDKSINKNLNHVYINIIPPQYYF